MDVIECLVVYGAHKVVVNVGGERKRPDLISSLAQKELFQGFDLNTSHILIYHAGFDTDVDMTEDVVLENRARIKIRMDEAQFRVMDVVNQEEHGPSRAPLRDLSEYRFPQVPLDIKQSLAKHKKGLNLKSRNRIIQWLYHDLCQYTLYPDKLYAEAAKGLIRNFPVLEDTTGTKCDSWHVALRFKAKRERKKLRDQERAAEEGEEEAPARPKQQRVPRTPCPKRVIRPGTNVVLPADGEDKESVDGHVLEMQRELCKTRPNMVYVADAMARTFASRRLWVTTEHPTVAAVLSMYPAYQLGTILQQEFTAATGKSIQDSLTAALARSSLRILEAARGKRHLGEFFEDLDRRIAIDDDGPSDEMLTKAALCALPALVNERSVAFLRPSDPAELPTYPAVGYEGSSIYDATSLVVSVDELQIAEPTLLAAVSTMTALYWALNMEFPPKATRTFQLLSHMIGVDSGLVASPLVLMAIGIING
ncbi:uncharacterized protein LOC115327577 [Ixodes scapularis]|uniref:uncharacterized protein LOC115327577 n=1 Tax=Ixodes scapularis TaxID=6945 RepID=UPI001A9D7A07|nr:uncharacterized protein LOC115327577 [Ixodes scapularis]